MSGERSMFDEIQDTKRLLNDQRESLYSLQKYYSPEVDKIIHDREIMIKGLESYLNVLEHTVGCVSRNGRLITMETRIVERAPRKKNRHYNGED